MTVLQDEVATSGDRSDKDVDYANLGGRANDILRLAQEQARELVQNATVEAEKVKEQARREATGCATQRPERATRSRPAVPPRLISYAASCATRSRRKSTRPRPRVIP